MLLSIIKIVSDQGCVMKQGEVLCSDDGWFSFLNVFAKSKECATGCYNIPNCGTWTYNKTTGECWYLERTVDNENHCNKTKPDWVWGSRQCGKAGIIRH